MRDKALLVLTASPSSPLPGSVLVGHFGWAFKVRMDVETIDVFIVFQGGAL